MRAPADMASGRAADYDGPMPTTVQDLSDANYVESIREHARWQNPCELVEQDGLLLVAGPNAFPAAYRNCVVRVDQRVPAKDTLARARDFFGSRRRGFTVITRDSRDSDLASFLPAAGLKPFGDLPCMLIEAPLAEPRIPADVRVERFSDVRHVLDAVEINAEAYEAIKLPPHEARVYFGRPERLLSPNVEGYVAYRASRPASTALTIFSGDGAGVYWVGTANGAQRRGLAEICTRLATNAGFARGAKVVTLQASPFGEPIYQRLGYRTYDRTRRFMELPAK
jgi:ribosomal protein S18 acetylase RimI-like enzyme